MASVSANSGISQNQLVANALNKQNESEEKTPSSEDQQISSRANKVVDSDGNNENVVSNELEVENVEVNTVEDESNNENLSQNEATKELKPSEEADPVVLSDSPNDTSEISLDEELLNEKEIDETEFGEKLPDGKKWKFFLEPLIGYGQSQWTKSLVSESVNPTSLVSPSSIKDWNIRINVGMQYENFFVKSGIRFQELNQKFNVKNTTSEISDEYQYNESPDSIRVDIAGSDYLIIKVSDGSNGFNLKGFNSLKYDTVLLTVTDNLLVQNKADQESQGSFRYKIQYINIPFLDWI